MSSDDSVFCRKNVIAVLVQVEFQKIAHRSLVFDYENLGTSRWVVSDAGREVARGGHLSATNTMTRLSEAIASCTSIKSCIAKARAAVAKSSSNPGCVM